MKYKSWYNKTDINTDIEMKMIPIILSLVSTIANAEDEYSSYEVGDIVMQSDPFETAAGIKILTGSKYNHVGIVVEKNDTLYIVEALATVRYTPIDEFIVRGEDYKHLRLKDSLTSEDQAKINQAVVKYIGKRYDPVVSWDDSKMYCSELVQKVYKDAIDVEVTKERKIKGHMMVTIVPLLKSGIIKVPAPFSDVASNIDVNEIVVTPADIMRSRLLEEVN